MIFVNELIPLIIYRAVSDYFMQVLSLWNQDYKGYWLDFKRQVCQVFMVYIISITCACCRYKRVDIG